MFHLLPIWFFLCRSGVGPFFLHSQTVGWPFPFGVEVGPSFSGLGVGPSFSGLGVGPSFSGVGGWALPL